MVLKLFTRTIPHILNYNRNIKKIDAIVKYALYKLYVFHNFKDNNLIILRKRNEMRK